MPAELGQFGGVHVGVLFKLAINVVATGVLLLCARTLGLLADRAGDPAVSLAQLRSPSPRRRRG